jgi:hypothetical protein
MKKNEIDNYITNNYKDLVKYSKAMIYLKNLNETPDYFVTQTYLHLLKNKEKLTNDNIKDYISTFIYKNSSWVNSTVREMGSVLKTPQTTEFIEEMYDFEDNNEFEMIVDDEISMTDYETIVELYRQSLISPYKIRIAQAFFDGKNYTVRKFANHFGFSTTPAMKILQELKADINNFKKNLEKTKK